MPNIAGAVIAAEIGVIGSQLRGRSDRRVAEGQERSATEASNATERATNAAIALEREKEAERRREHEVAVQQYQQQWEAWNAARTGMMSRYGINPPPMAAGPRAAAPGAKPPGAPPTLGTFAGGPLAKVPGMSKVTPVTPINLPATTAEALIPYQGRPPEPPVNLGNLEDWNEWRNYGRPRA